MEQDVLDAQLSRLCMRIFGSSGAVSGITRLSGGANMESTAFEYGGKAYVLRRSPSADLMAGRTFGHDTEAALVRAAFAAGVKAPEVVGEIAVDDNMGTGYVMRRVVADVNPAAILARPPPSLLGDLAQELAKIHRIPLDRLPMLPAPEPADMLADLHSRFYEYGDDRPVFALALKWLDDHMLGPVAPVLLHGDFRMGNIMVDGNGLAAVLDWELAHLGDRHQDLAFGCINSWRFGHIDQPAFGCGQFEHLWSAYGKASGFAVEPDRFQWWLVYSTLWWGMCCLQMAEIWRGGLDSSLERAVIGRRASETEVDLLLLLEGSAPREEMNRRVERLSSAATHARNDENSMARRSGEPSALELLEALTKWIASDIKPKTEGRDKFMASVALNALGMLQRSAQSPVAVHDKHLADDIRTGRQTLATPGLLAHLKALALAKLAADQPRYSALAAARTRWSDPDAV